MSKVLQKSCKGLRVVTAEARDLLRQVAGPRWLGESVKAHLWRTARKLGWPVARTSNIHYGRARIIRAEEWIRLNEELSALTKSAARRQGDLNEIEILARAAALESGEGGGPLGMEAPPAGPAGHWPVRRPG